VKRKGCNATIDCVNIIFDIDRIATGTFIDD